jgi:hypothetical protein
VSGPDGVRDSGAIRAPPVPPGGHRRPGGPG